MEYLIKFAQSTVNTVAFGMALGFILCRVYDEIAVQLNKRKIAKMFETPPDCPYRGENWKD